MYMFEKSNSVHYLNKTEYQIDIHELNKDLDYILNNYALKYNQFGFTYRPGTKIKMLHHDSVGSLIDDIRDDEAELFNKNNESDWMAFIPYLEGSYFHWIYRNIPIAFGRMRIMKLSPKTCLSVHTDLSDRHHIAIKTNTNAYMFFEEADETRFVEKIPADGFVYKTKTTVRHTVFNGSLTESRYHLVFS